MLAVSPMFPVQSVTYVPVCTREPHNMAFEPVVLAGHFSARS